MVQNFIEKVNVSNIFGDFFCNIDNEIESLEEIMNFQTKEILDNFLKDLILESSKSEFEEFEKLTKEAFFDIDKDFWVRQQEFYNKFMNTKEDQLFRWIKGCEVLWN